MGYHNIIHFYNNPFTILLHSFRIVFYNLFTFGFYILFTSTYPLGAGGGLYLLVGGLYNTPPTRYNFYTKKHDKARLKESDKA